jgi:hypothetical protein
VPALLFRHEFKTQTHQKKEKKNSIWVWCLTLVIPGDQENHNWRPAWATSYSKKSNFSTKGRARQSMRQVKFKLLEEFLDGKFYLCILLLFPKNNWGDAPNLSNYCFIPWIPPIVSFKEKKKEMSNCCRGLCILQLPFIWEKLHFSQ